MIPKAVRLTLTVLGGLALIGGAAAWYVWVNGDAYARDELHRRLAELAPQCHIEIGKTRFDWDRTLSVRDFAMGSKRRGDLPTLSVPEGLIEVDRERLVNDHEVEVTSIRLIRPQLDLVRRADGRWAINELMPFHLNDIPIPEWKIEEGTLRFILERPAGEPVVLLLRDTNLRLVPSEGKRLIVKGLGDISNAGQMQVSGEVDLETGVWSLTGTMKGVSTAGDIAGFALKSSQGLRNKVASLGEQLRETEDRLLADAGHNDVRPNVAPLRTVSRSNHTLPESDFDRTVSANGATSSIARTEPVQDLAGLGIEANVDVDFTVGRLDPAQPVRFQVGLTCNDGRISNPLLPFPLRHLRGRIDWDNERLTLKGIEADSNKAVVKLDGAFVLGGETPTGSCSVHVADLVITDGHDARLPAGVTHFLDVVRPQGTIDLVATFERGFDAKWSAREFMLTAKGASVRAAPFAYPVREIVGTLRQTQPGRFEANMTGVAGSRPVQLDAVVNDPGAAAAVDVRITTDHLPIDDTLLDACPPSVRETLQNIGLQGTAETLNIVITRPAGPDQHYRWGFQGRVVEGVIDYVHFPYRLTHASGDLFYESGEKLLTLQNVVAAHGTAVLKGSGTFREPPDLLEDGTSPIAGPSPGLNLTVDASKVPIDSDLRAALPPAIKKIWDELKPDGTANAKAQVIWIPGHEPDIELKNFTLHGGSVYAKCFPYVLSDVEARASYVPPRLSYSEGRPRVTPATVTIHEFVGWHVGGVRVESPATVFQLQHDGNWQLHLPRLIVEDIVFESDLRRALPEDFSRTIESLNPRGRFLVEGRLDFAGSTRPGAPVSAEWDLALSTRTPASFDAGIEVTQAMGRLRTVGSQTSTGIDLQGAVSFSQADVFGQRLESIRGPIAFKSGRVTLGATRAVRAAESTAIPNEERLVAKYLGGDLTVDAEIALDNGPEYIGRATLAGGRLEQYATQQPGRSMKNLAGVMNGYVDFEGRGNSPLGVTGHGSLDISPAALYELPVMMQILTLLSTPDQTLFRQATSDFTIHDGAFYFVQNEGGAIVLAGDAVWLIGQGRVTFDRRLALEFYNVPPRTPVSRIPVVGQVVGGVLNVATKGWMSFVVTGTADDPVVRGQPFPALNEGMKRMFEAFGPPPTTRSSDAAAMRR